MSAPEPETEVAPPKRHRWARREFIFIGAAIVAVLVVIVASQFFDARRPLPGQPLGGMPPASNSHT